MANAEYEQWIARGRAHQGEGRAVDAMLCYRRAMRADARAPGAPFHLGEVEWQLGRFGNAIAAWREALRLHPAALAPAQALAEALLATGEPADAATVAAQVLALAPADVRAGFIAGVASMLTADGNVDAAAAHVADALARDPSLAVVATLAEPLALALDRLPAGQAKFALLSRLADIAASMSSTAAMPTLLFALLCEYAGEGEAALFDAARERRYGPADHEALRRIAHAAVLAAPRAAPALAQTYASLCAAVFASSFPLVWLRRTAGMRLRVVVLIATPPGPEAIAALDVLAALPRAEYEIAIALLGAAALPDAFAASGAARDLPLLAMPPITAANDAKRVAALDADVLIDLAGLRGAAGPMLARRPARTIVTPADLPAPNVGPLVDRADATIGGLGRLLTELRIAVPASGEIPDAAAMAAMWEDAVRVHQQGALTEARERYARVLALQPGHAPAHYLLGIVLRDSSDPPGARREFGSAIAAAPRFVEARIAAAKAAQDAGDAHAAAVICAEGLAWTAEPLPLLRALGLALLAANDGVGAADAFARALALDPADGETHYNRGVALQMQRRLPEAAREYQHALAFRPDLTAADFNLGALFRELGAVDGAILAYENVIRSEPSNVAAYRNLGEVLFGAGRIDAWFANFDRFEARCPAALSLAVQALEVCQHRGDFAAVERYLDGLRAERFRADDALELCDSLEQLLYLLLFFDVEPAVISRFARTYDATARRVYGTALARPAARRPGRLRIGYLGADLRNHVMGKMIWHAVRHHDRSRFALHFYSLSRERDEWTERFAEIADRFEVLADLPEREAAMRIAADDLDLLVDLSTHTQGAKPGILALAPARVQITHVASAGTVGLSTIDFKLTDRRADVAESQDYQIETLLPMDGCVYPYRHIAPAAAHPFRRSALGVAADAVLIGAFVAPLKLSRRCLALWGAVLARIPRARLVFSPTNPAYRDSYARLAAAAGIAPDRLVFLPQGRDEAENQARYELIDFVLDPMPFGGVNGTLEALDMGVPVVTLVGKRHGERAS
ncbi:MAG: tetratricopeptide repeat protein, partial [Betaproteobacteria bacterium]|nr:tetratricopeptide repeat protein [Betaproteobacteria bacterium]